MSASPEERLRARLRREDRLLVAFSGGADSALLAALAHQELGGRAVAVTAVSASLPAAERRAAAAFARRQGLAHVQVCTDELDDPSTWPTTGRAASAASPHCWTRSPRWPRSPARSSRSAPTSTTWATTARGSGRRPSAARSPRWWTPG